MSQPLRVVRRSVHITVTAAELAAERPLGLFNLMMREWHEARARAVADARWLWA